jgi:hypothetical protein
MAAVPADALPDDQPGIWALETKLDGWRCLAIHDRGRVVLQSRQQRPLSRYFPEVVAAVRELGVDAVFDGELVAWTDGHLDFAALQQRIHPSAARARRMALALPACLVVFDLLARKGTDFRDRPYAKRRRKLEKLLDRPLPAHLALMPMTTSTAVARLWMADHAAVGGRRRRQAPRPPLPGGPSWWLAEDPHKDHGRSRRRRGAGPARAARRADRRLPGCAGPATHLRAYDDAVGGGEDELGQHPRAGGAGPPVAGDDSGQPPRRAAWQHHRLHQSQAAGSSSSSRSTPLRRKCAGVTRAGMSASAATSSRPTCAPGPCHETDDARSDSSTGAGAADRWVVTGGTAGCGPPPGEPCPQAGATDAPSAR